MTILEARIPFNLLTKLPNVAANYVLKFKLLSKGRIE